MLEVFVLIGWIDGSSAGGVVGQEFNSLETCKAAKVIYDQSFITRTRLKGSWVECVKK